MVEVSVRVVEVAAVLASEGGGDALEEVPEEARKA